MSGGNFTVIVEVRVEGGVSGGVGVRRFRAGGCARSRFCRRSGRNRSCLRSVRFCIVVRVGLVFGIR